MKNRDLQYALDIIKDDLKVPYLAPERRYTYEICAQVLRDEIKQNTPCKPTHIRYEEQFHRYQGSCVCNSVVYANYPNCPACRQQLDWVLSADQVAELKRQGPE